MNVRNGLAETKENHGSTWRSSLWKEETLGTRNRLMLDRLRKTGDGDIVRGAGGKVSLAPDGHGAAMGDVYVACVCCVV